MNAIMLRKEAIELRRDRRFIVALAVFICLLLASALDGWNRADTDSRARGAAVDIDRDVWVNQGENNPHGAAHFARYAFREYPPLAAFDPGVFDFAGAAFWMEAHTQNPTTLRRAEDAAVRAPFAAISPAWVIQVLGTLLLSTVLFSSVVGERERGTLRSLSGAGLSARNFVIGKLSLVIGLVVFISIISILVTLLVSLEAEGLADVFGLRAALLILVYTLGLLSYGLLILSISAAVRSSSTAFNITAGVWLFSALLSPVLVGQLSTTLYPDIDEQQLKNDIQLRAQSPFWVGDERDPAVAELEAKVVGEFGAESFEDLGFDREALVLQAHEEFANEIYDELYGALNTLHTRQDKVLGFAAFLSPVAALARLSSGISGTDLMAQQSFALQAEQHRRKIIAQLNRNMMVNAGDKGFEYMADRTLWEAIPEFRPQPPGLADVLANYFLEALALVLWSVGSVILALQATRSAVLKGI